MRDAVYYTAICILSVALMSSAQAQEPTPSQTAIQIDNVINQWAQTIERQQKQLADLQKQLEEAKAAKENK